MGKTGLHRHKRRTFSTLIERWKAQSALETCIDPWPQKIPLSTAVITVEPAEQSFAAVMMDYIADDSESAIMIQIGVYQYTIDLRPFVTWGVPLMRGLGGQGTIAFPWLSQRIIFDLLQLSFWHSLSGHLKNSVTFLQQSPTGPEMRSGMNREVVNLPRLQIDFSK